MAVVKTTGIERFNLFLYHISRQTIASDIELIVIGENTASLEEVKNTSNIDQISSVICLDVGSIDNLQVAIAVAFRAAKAPIVAHLEDHVFLPPDWAQTILAAHQDDQWAVVCSSVHNANPATVWSWATILPSYGQWLDKPTSREINTAMRLNATYKREVLMQYDDQLEYLLGPWGDAIQQRLHSDGYRFYLAAETSLNHVNPSKAGVAADMLFLAGRTYANQQIRAKGWNLPMRLLIALCTPAFPIVRFIKRHNRLFDEQRLQNERLKLYWSYFLGLTIRAFGNMVGFMFGPGQVTKRLDSLDRDRLGQLTSADSIVLMTNFHHQ